MPASVMDVKDERAVDWATTISDWPRHGPSFMESHGGERAVGKVVADDVPHCGPSFYPQRSSYKLSQVSGYAWYGVGRQNLDDFT